MQKNLFDLTEKQIETSKMMYDGKVIKCLVAPYHTQKELEPKLEYTKTTFLFPENEMSVMKIKQFISMIVSNKNLVGEIRIITANQNIIMDMIGDCVRVLTESGEVVDTGTKTFMANIHDIRYELLENEKHQISKDEREKGREVINDIIKEIEEATKNGMSKDEYDILLKKISIVGEPIISTRLRDMASDIKVKLSKEDKEDLIKRAQEAIESGDVRLARSLINTLENL